MAYGFLAFSFAFIIVGLALDAAFFWRFRNMLEVFRITPSKLSYRYYAFPRLILLMGSAFAVAWGSYNKPSDAVVIIAGCSAFMIFSSYPHVDLYFKSKRRE